MKPVKSSSSLPPLRVLGALHNKKYGTMLAASPRRCPMEILLINIAIMTLVPIVFIGIVALIALL